MQVGQHVHLRQLILVSIPVTEGLSNWKCFSELSLQYTVLDISSLSPFVVVRTHPGSRCATVNSDR